MGYLWGFSSTIIYTSSLATTIAKCASDVMTQDSGECRFWRGSRVEGNMSSVEGNMSRVEVESRGRGSSPRGKKCFSCGLYLLGQNSLIFLASGKTKIKNFEFSSSSGRSQF